MTIRLIIEAEGVITYWICSMEAVPKKERANDRAICLYAVAPPASPRKGAVIADQTATATSKTCVDVSDGNLIDQPGENPITYGICQLQTPGLALYSPSAVGTV